MDEVEIVVHCCKSVLIYNSCAWSKKDTGDGFDILQGSFYGVEVCELVGLLILNEIAKENFFEQNKFGIYRDDGLAIVETKLGPIIEHLSKRLRKVFNRFGLEITLESNLVKTDFLVVDQTFATIILHYSENRIYKRHMSNQIIPDML